MHQSHVMPRSLAALLVVALSIAVAAPALAADPSEPETSQFESQSQSTANLQQALSEKGFYRGPVDGNYGSATQQAVMAFRKEIGASRSYSWSNSLWDELNTYVKPWTFFRFDEPNRIEVNLSRQVLYLFEGGNLAAIFPISGGNGALFPGFTGKLIRANTPTGDFRIQRHIRGMRISYLGSLWNPWYFTGGYAFHGSSSVPAYPASHGCIRLPMWDSDWLESRLSIGMPVHIWYEPSGVGPVFAPGGQLPVGGTPPCPSGVICDTVAFQDAGSRFYLWDQITTDPSLFPFWFGNPRDVPFSGDWNGDGVDTLGLYRRSNGFVYLRNSNTQGVADISFYFGNPGDLPVVGDFNGDGVDTVSIYRPSEQRFYIINRLGADGAGLGAADYSFVFGNPGDRPFTGDFDGDGIDTIGLHRPSTGRVLLHNANSDGSADVEFVFGNPGDKLIAGDWNGDGTDTVAVFRPRTGVFYVKNNNSSGAAEFAVDVGLLTDVVPMGR